MQLEDNIVGPLLKAKETNQKPSADHAKSQGLEYRWLCQQWEQLVAQEGVLWRYYAQPRENQGWLQLVISCNLRPSILEELHQGVGSGHLGHDKTLSRLKQRFHWPGHFNDVRNWCKSCVNCNTKKISAPTQRAPMGTIIAGYPMQIVDTDLVGPLPESENGNRYILVVADYFTCWMEAFPIPNQEASTVATKLVDEVFLRFSVPVQLHSDQGRQFESQLLFVIYNLLNITKTRTTPNHPQCDGLVEWFNRTLLNMLATCVKDCPFEWEHHIRKVCMAYNSSVQSSTGYTPFYWMFGRQTRLPVDIMYGTSTQQPSSPGEHARLLQCQLQSAFELVKEHTSRKHNSMI